MSVKGQGPRDAGRRVSEDEYRRKFDEIDWSNRPRAQMITRHVFDFTEDPDVGVCSCGAVFDGWSLTKGPSFCPNH